MRGSGTATITTAPRYLPGRENVVSGTGAPAPAVARADGQGRLTFSVDLGPGHTA